MSCACGKIKAGPSFYHKAEQWDLPLSYNPLMRRIYTFCEVVNPAYVELADLWKRSWAKHGWQPVVLNLKDAVSHPLYRRYRAHVEKLPTVNDRRWETMAYIRYLAYETKAPGVFGDVDVINYGIKPEDLKRIPEGEPEIYGYAIAGAPNPGLWVGNQAGIRAFITDVLHGDPPMDTVRGQPHTSDMYYFFRHAKKHPGPNLCPNAGLENWKTAPAVHWHNSAITVRFGRNMKERAKVIQDIRPI